MPFTCCVPMCAMNKKPFHSFPANEQQMQKWCRNIQREDLLQKCADAVHRNYRVCDVHFSDDMKFVSVNNRTNLKVGSFPSLHIRKVISAKANVETTVLMSAEVEAMPGTSAGKPFQPYSSITATSSDQPSVEHIRKPTKLQKRRNLLLEVKLRKQAQLTPKALKLYKIAKEYKETARKLKHTVDSNKRKIKAAIQEAESGAIFQSKVNAYTYKFLQSQISQHRKSPRGRRFTREDKVLALALLKRGPKSYALLRKIFALPSRKTLVSMLAKLPFKSGINIPILKSLKRSVQHLNPRDRHCILMFDEMSLQPLLCYSKSQQKIVGFQSMSEENSTKIADHAIVFMIKGIAKKWKQPIAYYFTQNGMANAEIAKNVKLIIHHLMEIGLTVDATVCDQYNKTAVNMLVQETKMNCAKEGRSHELYSFFVDKAEIFPLFDFPHLLKGIRNNMLKYDVSFKWKTETFEIASWRHIELLYNIDFYENDDFRMLNRLTDEHVNKLKIKKMKVKHAAQVFSHRVQSTMRGLLTYGREGLMPVEANGTANFVLFMDKLFDSVNGSNVQPKDGKILRRAVSKATDHVAFWQEAIKVLQSITFFGNSKKFVPPTVTNWLLSLQNLIRLWQKLQDSGFEFLLTRNLNQDPLENFFSCICSHGIRNVNPSCSAFISAFKALIINNFMASHSINANCEEDESEGVLDSLGHYLDTNIVQHENLVPLNYGQDRLISMKCTNDNIVMSLHGYLAGYLARNVLKLVGACTVCRKELISQENTVEHNLIQIREYRPNVLLRSRTKFIVLFNLCVQIVHYWLPRICCENNLLTKLYLIIDANINKQPFGACEHHNLYKIFVNMFINFYCYTWVCNVNKILQGTQTKNVNDIIKQQALKLHLKYKSKYYKLSLMKRLQQ